MHLFSRSHVLVAVLLFVVIISISCANTATPQQSADAEISQTEPTSATEVQTVTQEKIITSGEINTSSSNNIYELLVDELAISRDVDGVDFAAMLRRVRNAQSAAAAQRVFQFAIKRNELDYANKAARLWIKYDYDNPQSHHSLALVLIKQLQHVAALDVLVDAVKADVPVNALLPARGATFLHGRNLLLLINAYQLYEQKMQDSALMFALIMLLHQQLDQNIAVLDFPATTAPMQKLKRLYRANKSDELPRIIAIEIEIALRAKEYAKAQLQLDQAIQEFPQFALLYKLQTTLLSNEDNSTDASVRKYIEYSGSSPIALFQMITNTKIHLAPETKNYLLNMQQELYTSDAISRKDFELITTHLITQTLSNDNLKTAKLLAARIVQNTQYRVHAIHVIADATARIDGLAAARKYLLQQRSEHISEFNDLVIMEANLLAKNLSYAIAASFLDDFVQNKPFNQELVYYRGLMHAMDNNVAAMENDFKKMLEFQPEHSMTLNAYGYTLLINAPDRQSEAVEYIERAYQLRPNSPSVIDSIGWERFHRRNFDEAVVFIQLAYQMESDPEVAGHFIEILWSLDRHKAAKRVYQHALTTTDTVRQRDKLKAIWTRLQQTNTD